MTIGCRRATEPRRIPRAVQRSAGGAMDPTGSRVPTLIEGAVAETPGGAAVGGVGGAWSVRSAQCGDRGAAERGGDWRMGSWTAMPTCLQPGRAVSPLVSTRALAMQLARTARGKVRRCSAARATAATTFDAGTRDTDSSSASASAMRRTAPSAIPQCGLSSAKCSITEPLGASSLRRSDLLRRPGTLPGSTGLT